MTFRADLSSTRLSEPLWVNGWFRHAQQLVSANFGPRPLHMVVDVAIIHSISLPPGQYGTGCVQQLFTNQLNWDAHPYFDLIRGLAVSAHFFIERDGKLWQFVSCDDRAWHAGKSEFQGRANCNDYSIGIELEGLEGQTFETCQYHTLNQLCSSLIAHYPIAHITGHEHVAPGRKRDPGDGFDWRQLQQHLPNIALPEPRS